MQFESFQRFEATMSDRKASIDEYNATCDDTNDDHDFNRAILMSSSDTLSSTVHNITRDLSTTLTGNSSKADSTILEKTITLPAKQDPPKITGDEILIDHPIPIRETFVSRIPKCSDAKLKQPVEPNDDKTSSPVRRTKNLNDVTNIRQSNLWPALTALETSLHSPDEQISPDDTYILKKLDEEFNYSPRNFATTLMTIIEESFAEWDEGHGDVSRFGLMELLKATTSSGKRLEDESPPAFVLSSYDISKQTDNEAKSSACADYDDKSMERFVSLPSESQALADEPSQSAYSNFEARTITSDTGRISTNEPKRYVNTARITVNSETPANFTNQKANCRRNRTPVKRILRSPISRPKRNAVNFEGISDESDWSHSSLETPTVNTGTERISSKEPKKYIKTPRIAVDPGTPTNFRNGATNCRRDRTPVKRILRSPVSRSKNAVSFEGITDESPQSSYLSLEALRITSRTGRISTKEPKKYFKTPRITVDPGTPMKSTNRAENCRRNRTPLKRILRSPISRPKINAPSCEAIVDHSRDSPILSPLSNKDDDEYITAESETDEVSDMSENTKTAGSPKKKLDMSNIALHHREWVTTFEQRAKYTCRTTERTRKLSSHTNKLEMRWLKKLTEKRQKCFDLVDEMLQKSDSGSGEPKVKSPCHCSPCTLSNEFCRILLAFHEYMQYAMNTPEVTERNNNHRFVTSVKVNLQTKNSKSPRVARKSIGKQRKSLNKMPSPKFVGSHVKLTAPPRNRGVSPKKMKETYVDTSSIGKVSQLRRVFSPRARTAGCSESKTSGAKQTIPRKIASSVGSERKDHFVFLPGHGPSHYKKIVSPVGEYIRGKKAT